jgi:hypothetical protein
MIVIRNSDFTPTSTCSQHVSTDWEVYADASMQNLIDFSYNDTQNLVEMVFDIPYNYEYVYVRSRYTGDQCISNWSALQQMSNLKGRGDIIVTPQLSVFIDPNDQVNGASLSASPFTARFAQLQLTHQATDWIVKDINNQIIWSSLGDTVNLTQITIPASYFTNFTTYAFLVQYRSSTPITNDIRSNFTGQVVRYVKTV